MRAILAALVLAAVPRLAAADVDAASAVTAVTVYQGTARVTRTAHLTLPAGSVTVRLRGLSTRIHPDTLRVEGTGTAKAHIQGVTVETESGTEGMDKAFQAAQAKVDALKARDQALVDRIAAAKARIAFVDAFQRGYAHKAAADLPVRPVDPASLGKIADFVASEHEKASSAIRAAQGKRRALSLKIQAAEAGVRKLMVKRGFVTDTAAIGLSVDHPGRFTLTVSYLVTGAGWRPVWDAHLDPATDEVTLSLYGRVTQVTGVDWPKVALGVSTAEPARGLKVPELAARYLTRRPVVRYHRAADEAEALEGPAPPMAGAAAMAEEKAPAPLQRRRLATIQVIRAKVTHGALSATFQAPSRLTVGGGGEAKRAFLDRWTFAAKVERLTAPRRDPTAYLVATTKNDTGVPLLPGRANVFLGSELVGHTRLPLVAEGDQMKIPFGADDRVKVERKVLERKHAESGLFSKSEVMRFHVRTTVDNLYGHPVKVTLLDQVPVSRDQSIQVKVLDGSTRPTGLDQDHPGVRRHLLEIPAHGTATVELYYEVTWPKGLPISGLD